MAIRTVKKAARTPQSGEDETRQRVADMLKEIELGGEAMARSYGEKLDSYTGPIEISRAEIEAAAAKIPEQLKQDIAFSHQRVRAFAERQKASVSAFETEIEPGIVLGQRLIPVATAGCYVPGGRYAHVASAIMSITTAKVAGVQNVIACSAPHGAAGINPGILYAMHYCGADRILALGGVQGIAALAFGLFTGHPADMLVGPGNRFVAEAKRMLFGRVGIDLFAGPTEIAIIADASADPAIVAADLVGQSEHGPDSPAWLVTTSGTLAHDVMVRVPQLIAALPDGQRRTSEVAWRDYGEVIVVDSN